MSKQLLTTDQIAERLQITRITVTRMAAAGRIPAIKVGREWRFDPDEFDRWLQQQHNRPTGKPTE